MRIGRACIIYFYDHFRGCHQAGYSHIADTISELFSPGAPNKALLDPLHTLYALLLVLFGIGILRYIQEYEQARRMGTAGAALYIAMGLLSLTSATVFPQDAWGSAPTFPGQLHIFVHGVISIISLISILLIGIWFGRVERLTWFRTYSFITLGLAILSAGFFMANMGSPIMGLTERIAGLIGFLWTFTLALRILRRNHTAQKQAVYP
ncbi:MAG TPA: DUF998 domain-containing protein [Anaerolineales bacterium]|nr:DUF998 domain-containing protein [Anaerolineales bacterium]